MSLLYYTKRFRLVPTTATCLKCKEPFTYLKSCRPQIRCRPCAREHRLERMRICNNEYRRLERIRLEAARA